MSTPEFIPSILAAAVIKAMEIREKSFDKISADATQAKDDADRTKFQAENPDQFYYGAVDYAKFYTKDFGQSAFEAAESLGVPTLWYPIYLLMVNSWNDIADWAANPAEYETRPDDSPVSEIDEPLSGPEN